MGKRLLSKPICSFWAMPYSMISCAIAVLMLRFGRKFLARSEGARGVRSGAAGAGATGAVGGGARVTVVEVVVGRREVSIQRVKV